MRDEWYGGPFLQIGTSTELSQLENWSHLYSHSFHCSLAACFPFWENLKEFPIHWRRYQWSTSLRKQFTCVLSVDFYMYWKWFFRKSTFLKAWDQISHLELTAGDWSACLSYWKYHHWWKYMQENDRSDLCWYKTLTVALMLRVQRNDNELHCAEYLDTTSSLRRQLRWLVKEHLLQWVVKKKRVQKVVVWSYEGFNLQQRSPVHNGSPCQYPKDV